MNSEAAPATAVGALAAQLIDYAGLFPPAGLPMETAVANYARYRETPESWALARFIVPVARLDEFSEAARPHTTDAPWIVSALAGGEPGADRAAIDRFNTAHPDRAFVDAVEVKTASAVTVGAAAHAFAGMHVYCEIASASDPAPLIEVVKRSGVRAKIRTGGVTPDAFPPASDVVRFIRRCLEYGVAFKATAGLHHPLRCVRALTYETDAPSGTMHGYLNVFLAAAAMRAGLPDERAEALLTDDDMASFGASDDAIWWRDVRLGAEQLLATRADFAIAFGSCSFEEPVGELREMGWI